MLPRSCLSSPDFDGVFFILLLNSERTKIFCELDVGAREDPRRRVAWCFERLSASSFADNCRSLCSDPVSGCFSSLICSKKGTLIWVTKCTNGVLFRTSVGERPLDHMLWPMFKARCWDTAMACFLLRIKIETLSTTKTVTHVWVTSLCASVT